MPERYNRNQQIETEEWKKKVKKKEDVNDVIQIIGCSADDTREEPATHENNEKKFDHGVVFDSNRVRLPSFSDA